MTSKKRGLGRGLEALLGHNDLIISTNESNVVLDNSKQAVLPIELITRGKFQPRKDFDENGLQELADSISAQGVVQPIVVRPISDMQYEIIAGERRWRASQIAGKSEIPVVIRDVDDQTAMAMALIENIQRKDLNALEEAYALNRLLNEFGLTHQEIAHAIGKSRATVTNLLRLLDLNDDIKGLVSDGIIEMGHARALLSLKGEDQTKIGEIVAAKKLSVRDTEALVKKTTEGKTAQLVQESQASDRSDPDVTRLINSLSEKLGAAIELKQSKNGKGKLVINYNSLEELDGILDHIR